jgi:hypothetical protein
MRQQNERRTNGGVFYQEKWEMAEWQ